ncbi:MAG: hypothetical protein H6868_08700 [Rhodospirillales bacterium]|nr:hypothetical protein [Rhodospirillales bacterium]
MKQFISKRSYKRYLLTGTLCLLPALFILALNYFALYQSGEIQSPPRIAATLQNEDSLFGSGLQDLRREINLENIKLRQPDIIAFGSSRPLNFRHEYFSRSFSCACGAAPNLFEGQLYAEQVLKAHKPKVVLLSIDFWWFTNQNGIRPRPLITGTPPLTLQKLLKPSELALEGTIKPGQLAQLIHSGNDFTHITTDKKYGLLSITRGMGTRADGSYLGGIRLSDYAFEYYKQWADNLHNPEDFIRINERYGPGQTIREENIEQYARLVKTFQDQGVKVISILLPLAPTIYDALAQSPDHQYIFDLPEKIKSYSDEFYNFHNPHPMTSDICEFEDAHHSGDTVSMRVLLQILEQNPQSALTAFINKESLTKNIEAFSGHTIARFNPEKYLTTEKDFLNFGCHK